MGGWDAPWHWIVLAIVILLLVGYKKLPDASRAVGRSLRIFKTEVKGMSEDDKARESAREQADSEPRALPPAQVVRNDSAPHRPRPSPHPGGRATAGNEPPRAGA